MAAAGLENAFMSLSHWSEQGILAGTLCAAEDGAARDGAKGLAREVSNMREARLQAGCAWRAHESSASCPRRGRGRLGRKVGRDDGHLFAVSVAVVEPHHGLDPQVAQQPRQLAGGEGDFAVLQVVALRGQGALEGQEFGADLGAADEKGSWNGPGGPRWRTCRPWAGQEGGEGGCPKLRKHFETTWSKQLEHQGAARRSVLG